MYGAFYNFCGHCRHNTTCNNARVESSSGCPARQTETRCNKPCPDVTFVEYCGASSGCSKPVPCNPVISQDAERCAAEWTKIICKEVCLAEMNKNDCNDASGYCRDNITQDHTKEEYPSGSAARWTDARCHEAYPAREVGEYCRATGDHYKCNGTCTQVSGRCLYGPVAKWTGSQCAEVCTKYSRCQENRQENCSRCCTPLSGDRYAGAFRYGCDPGLAGPFCRYASPDYYQEPVCLRPCSRCDGFEICNPLSGVFYDQTRCAKVCRRLEGVRPCDAQVIAVIKHRRSVKITKDCTNCSSSPTRSCPVTTLNTKIRKAYNPVL